MPKQNDSNSSKPARRVYKASEFKSRRVDGKVRSSRFKPAAQDDQPSEAEPEVEPEVEQADLAAQPTEALAPVSEADTQAAAPLDASAAAPVADEEIGPDATSRYAPVSTDDDAMAGEAEDEPAESKAAGAVSAIGAAGSAFLDRVRARTHRGEAPSEADGVDEGASDFAGQPGGEEGETGEGSSLFDLPPRKIPTTEELKKSLSKQRLIGIGIAIVALIVIIWLISFAFNRCARYDDHADMQGSWYVMGTDAPIQIDDGHIYLTDDVSYEYTINDGDKTIRYTYGPMQGQGRYWFSEDRQNLVITDGKSYTGTSTAFDDLTTAFRSLLSSSDALSEMLEKDGVIAFSRTAEEGSIASKPASSEAAASSEASASGESASSENAEEASDGAATSEETTDAETDGGTTDGEYTDDTSEDYNYDYDSEYDSDYDSDYDSSSDYDSEYDSSSDYDSDYDSSSDYDSDYDSSSDYDSGYDYDSDYDSSSDYDSEYDSSSDYDSGYDSDSDSNY